MAVADPEQGGGADLPDPFGMWMVHYYSHGGIFLHPECPWCRPLVPDSGETPWLILAGVRIYAPRPHSEFHPRAAPG